MPSGEGTAPSGTSPSGHLPPENVPTDSTPPPSAGVGAVLAAARESRGLSVDEVSKITRVRSALVADIEADDFSHCAAPVYARGHIRSIARAVGVDADPLVAAYDRDHGTTPPPVIAPLPPPNRFLAPETSRRGRPHWMPIMLVVLLLVVIGGVVLLVSPGKDNGSSPTAGVTVPTVAGTHAPSAAPKPTTPPPATFTGVNLIVRITSGASWLQVTDDSQRVLVAQVLEPGTVRVFKDARQLRIATGNAGAVALSCNGRSLGTAGASGAVTTVTVALGAAGACTRA